MKISTHSQTSLRDFDFEKQNPFINTLDKVEADSFEGIITKDECLSALRNLKNGKSPGLGLDGYTAEIYKMFLTDLHSFYFIL